MFVSIDKINIGERLRQDNGDIAGLAQSIREHGLLHPVVIDANFNLAAGGRRLAAVQEVGMTEIEAKMLGELTEKELRVLELEENIRRKDLTEYGKARNLVEAAKIVAEVIKEEREVFPPGGKTSSEGEVFATVAKTSSPGGRPTRLAAPLKDVSERLGVPIQTINEAQQFADAGQRYPELVAFPKKEAIKTARQLDAMPDTERDEARQKSVERNREIERDFAKSEKLAKLYMSGFGAEITEEVFRVHMGYTTRTLDEILYNIQFTRDKLDVLERIALSMKKVRLVKA